MYVLYEDFLIFFKVFCVCIVVVVFSVNVCFNVMCFRYRNGMCKNVDIVFKL